MTTIVNVRYSRIGPDGRIDEKCCKETVRVKKRGGQSYRLEDGECEMSDSPIDDIIERVRRYDFTEEVFAYVFYSPSGASVGYFLTDEMGDLKFIEYGLRLGLGYRRPSSRELDVDGRSLSVFETFTDDMLDNLEMFHA